MEEGRVEFHQKGMDRVLAELAGAYEPRQAVREFITNSLDAKIKNRVEDITVVLAPQENRIVITDNGIGMDAEKLRSLSYNVGYGEKFGRPDMRGEKALGLLAFGSIGDAMHIISKPEGAGSRSPYNYLRWNLDKGITFKFEEIGSDVVDNCFDGGFSHGTMTVIDHVNPHIMDKVLGVGVLADWFSQLYTPALVGGKVRISVGKRNKRNAPLKMKAVEPIKYRTDTSRQLMNSVMNVAIKNEEVPGELEVLLLVDPNANGSRVGVYSKDVLVYPSLTEVEEFKRNPVFGSGKVSGYVNDRFNKLVLGRDGIDRQRNAFKAWYAQLEKIAAEIGPVVEEHCRVARRCEQDESINEVYGALCKVWQEMGGLSEGCEVCRDKKGVLTNVSGVAPPKGDRGAHRGGGGGKGGDNKIGPGSFITNPNGQAERVVNKNGKNRPFATPQPVPFPIHEAHMRSKLGESLGNTVVYVNESHEDYESRVGCRGTKGEDHIFTRYLIDIMANETANCAVREEERKGLLKGAPSLDVANKVLKHAEAVKYKILTKLGIK